MAAWYEIRNADRIDSPALVVYPDRVQENVDRAIRMAGGVDRLRPHVKTNKLPEVCDIMIRSGITRFKCATIAEGEMLGMAKAADVLLAYQPIGPKAKRFLSLVRHYPDTHFSCLIDQVGTAEQLNALCGEQEQTVDVYIDLNVGMNRTGIAPEKAYDLALAIGAFQNLTIRGIHAYDGHIHDTAIEPRKEAANRAFALAVQVLSQVGRLTATPLKIVMGGTPTFPIHAGRPDTECSPGTFVFWDKGYGDLLPDQPFQYAALVLSRVISVVDERHVCVDLGHKSVAAENPLPRVFFLNAPEAIPVSQSEEHMVLEVKDSGVFPVGKLLYGVPVHICPTVALYEKAYIIRNQEYSECWRVIARDRSINL